MATGSVVFMSAESAYISSEIFPECLKVQFVPRKPPGRPSLILYAHSTHCNSVEMQTYAMENEIILLSLPSQTSHYLQHLDRIVFKPSHRKLIITSFVDFGSNRCRVTKLQFVFIKNLLS